MTTPTNTMRTFGVAVAIVGLLATWAVTVGAAPTRSYKGANQAYEQGRWADAIVGYEALAAAGLTHQELYFNLGNAYLRADRLGPAIYNYERALRLSPGFVDGKHNLALAQAEVARRWQDRMKSAEKQTTWLRMVTYVSSGTLTVMFLVGNFLLFGGLIVVRLLRRSAVRTGVLCASISVGLATIAVAVLLWSNVQFTQHTEQAVVLADQLHMRDGAYEQSAEGALIHAGLRVRIIGRESGWVEIRLNNGHEGWVPSRSIGEL